MREGWTPAHSRSLRCERSAGGNQFFPRFLRGLLGTLSRGSLGSHREDRISQPFFERWVVAELLEELRVVLNQSGHDAAQSLVVLDPGVLRCVFHRILERGIRGNLRRDLLCDELADSVF